MSEERKWALILGASSGFGEACALHLARAGFDIAGVHLDRRGTIANVERIEGEIRALGRDVLMFNRNAAQAATRVEVMAALQEQTTASGGAVRVLMHTLAFGTLKPFVPARREDAISQASLEMTLDVMAHSLVYWTQDVLWAGLMSGWGRIVAMTSAGSTHVWPGYGAVSAAKCALEAHVRQLAVELGSTGITVNAIRAGVTDTPALRKIPGHQTMLDAARTHNPGRRLTTPDDVARVVSLLAVPEAGWLTGNVIGVDGGELAVS